MDGRSNPGSEKALGARHLIVLFLGGVAVCALFFSLGFLVGYNERSSKAAPAVERVTGPAVVPPTVNPPPAAGRAEAPESASATPANVPAAPAETPPLRSAPEPARPAAATDEVRAGFTVQVTALRAKQDAEALVSILKGRGYPVVVVAPEYARANDNLFRVQVGPFATRDEAEKVRAKLAKEGLFKDLFIKH